jgi:hypothetical protein
VSPETKQLLKNIHKLDRTLTASEVELVLCLIDGRAPVKVQTPLLPNEDYMTRAAVAQKLAVCETTIWRSPLVPYFPTPDSPRYHPGEVADYMSKRKGKKHARKDDKQPVEKVQK